MQLSDEKISDLASWLDMGMICYIHKESHKILYMPDPSQVYENEGFEDVVEEIEKNRAQYLEVEKMRSHESFNIMELFINEVKSESMKKRLRYALEKRKPFHNFKYEVDQVEDIRQQWFKFKSELLEQWVRREIKVRSWDEEE